MSYTFFSRYIQHINSIIYIYTLVCGIGYKMVARYIFLELLCINIVFLPSHIAAGMLIHNSNYTYCTFRYPMLCVPKTA